MTRATASPGRGVVPVSVTVMRLRWLLLGLLVVALLVPALMISTARILEPDGGRWVRLVSFTPYAVVLYAVVMLLLLLASTAGRGPWRGASAGLSLLLLPLLGLHLWWASPPYVGAPAGAAAAGETFTVMASNLLVGGADPARVVEVALANRADLVVLSEITPTALQRLKAAGLGEALPYTQGEAVAGVSGTMVFSGYPLGRARPLGRTAGGYEMTVELPQATIRLFAVHPRPPVGDAAEWRADHAALRLAATAGEGPAVIAGDFNAAMDHRPMRELEGRGFADAAEQARSGWQPTWPAAGQARVLGIAVPSMLAIDHVLVTEQLVATHTASVTIPGTDHRAVIANLALR